MKDISVDTNALNFSLHILVTLLVIGGLWSAWVPVQKNVNDSRGNSVATAAMAIETDPIDVFSEMSQGKYVYVNMDSMSIALYDGKELKDRYELMYVPQPCSPDAIPPGSYTVDKKTKNELSTVTMVRFPYYVQFGDRFAFHGTPTNAEGGPLIDSFAGSKMELRKDDAEQLYAFVEAGMPIFVTPQTSNEVESTQEKTVTALSYSDLPATSAMAYVVTNIETGEVLLEKGKDERYPIASITKLITAAVASDVVGHGEMVRAPDGEQYTLGDLYYPLLLRSDNKVADCIAGHAGTGYFLTTMNAYVRSLGMVHSSFRDASGLSPNNISTANDLVKLSQHLYEEKSYLFDITHEEDMIITATSGKEWHVTNQNILASDPHFRGGKLGYTSAAGQTALSVFNVPLGERTYPVAVIILHSKDWKQDTRTLLRWLVERTN